MKSDKFATFLRATVHLLDGVGRSDAAAAWDALMPAFTAKADANVLDVCGHIGRAATGDTNGHDVQLVLSTLPAISAYQNNKPLGTDLQALANALASHVQGNLSTVVADAIAAIHTPKPVKQAKAKSAAKPAASAETLADYDSRLRSSLGIEPQFRAVLAEVKNDKTISSAQASELALAIAGIPAKTKAKAWEAISARHATLAGGRARAKADGNRTAA
jgi:hypothetical protein